ncbi:MAG: 16S rRNA (guanine(527)-N(7))-methyltransferase RsmG [Nitrospirae bacterium]|nr:16S rRNA (guanine(527)-N(7))-methyltransferase RsmG [Nitrospirota bacterium]
MRPLELLLKGVKDFGINITDDQINLFSIYLRDLKKWNRIYNLTAIKDDKGIVLKHFIDSLSYLKAIPVRKGLKVIDIGTGAGFPGIPIKICHPDIVLTLVDSSMKKTLFLRHICRALSLEGLEIIQKRAEELKDDYESSFDILLTRALYKVKDLLSFGIPLLKRGGILVVSKGPSGEKELKEANKMMVEMEARIKDIISITLPQSNIKRNLIAIERY